MEIVCWCCWILTVIRWHQKIKKKGISSKVMEIRSTFIELLHKGGRTEINKGTEIRNFYLSYLNSTKQSHGECTLLLTGGIERERESDCYVECDTV